MTKDGQSMDRFPKKSLNVSSRETSSLTDSDIDQVQHFVPKKIWSRPGTSISTKRKGSLLNTGSYFFYILVVLLTFQVAEVASKKQSSSSCDICTFFVKSFNQVYLGRFYY